MRDQGCDLVAGMAAWAYQRRRAQEGCVRACGGEPGMSAWRGRHAVPCAGVQRSAEGQHTAVYRVQRTAVYSVQWRAATRSVERKAAKSVMQRTAYSSG